MAAKKKAKAGSTKRSGLSGPEIAVLSLLGAAVLAVAAFLVFPKAKDAFVGKKTASWEAQARFAAGQVKRPRDLALGEDGRAYVVELDDFTIVPVDLVTGRAGARWPKGGGKTLTEPFGLAARPGGGIAVADTFFERKDGRGRVVLLDSEGRVEKILSGAFFGPRDVLVEAGGNIVIADTGNHRLVFMDPQGRIIRETGQRGGGRGDFDEPRSLASDRAGVLHVLDMRNRRWVQLAPDGAFLKAARCRCLQPEGDVPYMAVSAGGRVAVSCPGAAQIQVSASNGKVVALLEFENQIVPYGLAFEDENTLMVADEASQGLVRVRFREKP